MDKFKSLFSNQKRTIITLICIIAAILAIGVTSAFAKSGAENRDRNEKAVTLETVTTAEQSTTKADAGNASDSSKGIFLDEAKEIALKDAGLTADDVTFRKAYTDYDDGIKVYEIEFFTADTEYEYEIVVSDGRIYSRDKERISATTQKVSAATEKATQTQGSVTLDQAKKIALQDAGVSASDADFKKARQDYEDGIKVYDIEFYTTDKEYEYEIRVSNGEILAKDVEKRRAKQTTTNPSSDKYIGIDKAKKIALNHAGVSSGKAHFTKAKFEKDDGVATYEIEFTVGKREYEYEINAKTGSIIDSDCDTEHHAYDYDDEDDYDDDDDDDYEDDDDDEYDD